MTKSQELILLEEVIKRFGPNSYLGPVLKELQPAIERDIRNDVVPDVDIERVKRECAELKAAARSWVQAEKDMLTTLTNLLKDREQALAREKAAFANRVAEVRRQAAVLSDTAREL